jgi:hypothetical protein
MAQHADHVGWNTRLEAGTWVPTFPNATYLLPRADHDYFAAADASFAIDHWVDL